MGLQEKLKSVFDSVVVFLEGEEEETNPNRPLYTKEELKNLYGIKKDIEKYPKHSE